MSAKLSITRTVLIIGLISIFLAGSVAAAPEDRWTDEDYTEVDFGIQSGIIGSTDDSDQLQYKVEQGDVVSVDLSTNKSGFVTGSIDYPGGYEGIGGDDPSSREITIEENGYVQIRLGGYTDEFNSFPHSWEIDASVKENADKWPDEEYQSISFGSSEGVINTFDDSEQLQYKVEQGDVEIVSSSSNKCGFPTV